MQPHLVQGGDRLSDLYKSMRVRLLTVWRAGGRRGGRRVKQQLVPRGWGGGGRYKITNFTLGLTIGAGSIHRNGDGRQDC